MWSTQINTGILQQLRRLAMLARCSSVRTVPYHLQSVLRGTEKLGHITSTQQSINCFCSASQDSVDRELTPTEKRELKALEIIKNFTEDEKLRLERLKVDYLSKKARLQIVPTEMNAYNWVRMMRAESENARNKLYALFRTKELFRASRKEKQQQKKEARESGTYQQRELIQSFLQPRYVEARMKTKYAVKGCQSLRFGNPLVVDMALREQTDREARGLMRQLNYMYRENLIHREPFHLHFTGIPEKGFLAEVFEEVFDCPEKYFIDFHKEEFHEVFPPERLVYLSPHSKTALKYNSGDIYIIGGLVDINDTKPYSLSKAKKLGIRSASLPVDQFYRLKKSIMTLDMVLKIMLEVNFTRDWEKAMMQVPARYWDMKKFGNGPSRIHRFTEDAQLKAHSWNRSRRF